MTEATGMTKMTEATGMPRMSGITEVCKNDLDDLDGKCEWDGCDD